MVTTSAFAVCALLSTSSPGQCPATDGGFALEMASTIDQAAEMPDAPVAPQPAPAQEPSPTDVVTEFYRAFVSGDFAGMESRYDEAVSFRDPVFEYSDRAGTMRMWRKLLGGGAGRFSFQVLGAEGDTVSVRWIADYELLGRPVHNEIVATMVVRHGRIVEHRDDFPWDQWAEQALPFGRLSSTRPVRWVMTKVLRFVVNRD